MKKILILFVLILIFFIPAQSIVFANSTTATARPLETQYPSVPRVTAPTTVETELPNYVKYIFNFSIWTAGFIALVALVIAGFLYLTSAGRPEMLKDAKDRIFSALAGLLILFSSWLILTTINPDLKNLQIKKPPAVSPALSAGIYLCKEQVNIYSTWQYIKDIKEMDSTDSQREQKITQVNDWLEDIKEKCWLVPTAGEIISDFNDIATRAYVVPSKTDQLYGALLYGESKYGGKTQVVYILESEPGEFEITKIEPSSVRPFVLKQPRSGVYVKLYELIDFNKADTSKKSATNTISGLVSPSYIDTSNFPTVGSVKIEGNLIVIFFKDAQSGDWPSDAELDVFTQTDANFYDNLMGRWCFSDLWLGEYLQREYYPCPKQMVIVSGSIY